GKVWTFNMLGNLYDIGIGIVEKLDACADHFAHVVRRDVRGHSDGDARRAVEQNMRQSRWKKLRLAQSAVEVLSPLDGAEFQLREQCLRETRQTRFGVTHRGKRFRIVG